MRRCQICHSTTGPWSAEDAYPKWLWRRMREVHKALPAEAVEPGWEQRPRVLLEPVCKWCNNRMNHLFEIRAKPLLVEIIDGSVIVLSPAQQVILGGWFVKTAAILGLIPYAVSHPETKTMAYANLRTYLQTMLKDGLPPSHATARIGYLEYEFRETSGHFVPPGWGMYEPGGTVTVITSVPKVVAEIVTGDADYIAGFCDATEDDDRFIRVWPPISRDAIWPPNRRLTLDDADELRRAWNHAPEIVRAPLGSIFLPPQP
jgi:hypothetical protein